MKTMKAAQFDPAIGKVTVREIPIPQHGDDELLVKIEAASLCHSDLMCISGQVPRPNPHLPITIGHEATGTVISIGSSTTGFQPGDSIGFLNSYHACWACKGCSGHFMLCSSPRMRMQGFNADGFFAEYAVIDPRSTIVLPRGMEVGEASPVFCAGITSYQAILAAELQPGQTIGIIGCGGLGQLAIQYARAFSLKVIALDIDDATLATATTAGATHTFNSLTNPSYATSIQTLTSGGCDAIAVFSASKQAYESAPLILAIGGTFVCVGLPAQKCEFNVLDISLQKYRFRGAGSGATREVLKECAEFTLKHGIRSQQRFGGLEEIEGMIERLEGGRTAGVRQVVRF